LGYYGLNEREMSSAKENTTVTAKLSQIEKKALKQLAWEKRTTMSNLIRGIVKNELPEN
jgi:hypothetical protein